jgi:serine/threonine-protein kinase HipA
MAKNSIITLHCFGKELGRIGLDEQKAISYFQYRKTFLEEGTYQHLFPLIFKRSHLTQAFSQFNNDTFKGLPPMLADSLPDTFGNIIFKTWLEKNKKDQRQISVLEQLAYTGNRGMGALEYAPHKEPGATNTIDIDKISEAIKAVLEHKTNTNEAGLDDTSLLNIFKMGTSAGGLRPKILVARNKVTGATIPGDIVYNTNYDHYLIKLDTGEQPEYSREVLEYSYYLTATSAGITMMPSRMIDDRHFATLRFDRQNGEKQHILTASGLTGWDVKDPAASCYEHLFDLAIFLRTPHKDLEQLYRRMVFNVLFVNNDDHLKNHTFIYDRHTDTWALAPAYDLTFSLNPMLHFTRYSRALSINGKRTELSLADLLYIADRYAIKNAKGVIHELNEAIPTWERYATDLGIPRNIIVNIRKHLLQLR